MSDSKMIWSYFLQLSVHMWDDENSPPRGWYLPVRYQEENGCDIALWDEMVKFIAERKFNMCVIDVGDGIQYDSHPEVSAPDAWSKDFLKQKLDEMRALGMVYSVGAAHWRVDVADRKAVADDLEGDIREWHRQQMYLAADERVTILGHPWACNPKWSHDFSLIPRSMNDELFASLREHGKYIECNVDMFSSPRKSDKFKHQYAEFLKEALERGIRVTYGSDCHGMNRAASDYPDQRHWAEEYLAQVGFGEGDFSELAPEDLLQA